MKGIFWVFFFFVGVFTHKLAATHIVGGEITYRCLGNSNFEIKLHIYRDCYTGEPWFDNPAIVGVYDAQWNLVKKLSLPWSSATNGNDTLPIVLSDPCLQIPPNVCVHRTTYTQVVNLPFKTGGYTLVYQRCCRNNLIKNLPDPLNTGISYTANISDQSLQTCNTGARFKSWPDVAICANIPINFDHSAFDADGDVLRYRLCTPLNGPDSTKSRPNPPLPGPYPELVWNNPPYSLQNLLGSVVPLKIDSISGLLTGIPSILGNFVVGVCVDEYRAGQLISTTRRDFQYNVADCGQPVAAFFTPEVVCDTLAVLFNNAGDNTANYQWYFNWPDINGPQSTEYSPLHTFPDTGIYQIALIAEPGDPCADTLIKQIRLANRYIAADMKLPEITCDSLGVVVSGTDLSSDPFYGVQAWQWRLTGPNSNVVSATSTLQNPSFQVVKSGNYNLRMIAISGNGCRDTVQLPFQVKTPELDNLKRHIIICNGQSVHLFPGADTTFSWSWTPADFLDNPLIANPLALPPTTTLYETEISDTLCVWKASVEVEVVNDQYLMATATPDTIYQHQSSQLEATLKNGLTGQSFVWSPSGTLNNPLIFNPLASPNETTDYEVDVNIGNDCVLKSTVRVVVLPVLCERRFVFLPTGFSPNGDGENEQLKLESTVAQDVYWAVYNRWGQQVFEADSLDDAWDGTFNGQPQPAEAYAYYLRVTCIGGEVFEQKGNITLLR